MKNVIVISAFPGAGKSIAIKVLTEKGYTVSDSDSSEFNFKMSEDGKHYLDINGDITTDRNKYVKNPNFITDYMSAVKERSLVNDIIFVSSHGEVREALTANDIPFVMVGYEYAIKDEVVSRIRNRNSNQPNEGIAKYLNDNWDMFISGMSDHSPKEVVELGSDEYLSDWLVSYM